MDQFYLSNIARYEKLVKVAEQSRPNLQERPSAVPTNDIDLTVCVRVRPLSDKDTTAGFPCAIYTQDEQASINVYDLYNHPRGLPSLKVTAL